MSQTLRLIADPPSELASPSEFAEAMSAHASGVVLVTCEVGGRPWGMTVTAFASVSADPPTVLVSLGSETTAARAIAATRAFGISILGEDLLPVALYGSIPRATKFLEPLIEAGRSSTNAIGGALAHLDCELTDAVEVADHTVFFGRVRAAWAARTVRRSSTTAATSGRLRSPTPNHEPSGAPDA